MNDPQNAILELEAIRADLMEKVKQIEATIYTLQTLFSSPKANEVVKLPTTQKMLNTDSVVSFRQRILNLIKAENRFMHVREIAEKLVESGLGEDVPELTRKISPVISSFRLKNTLVKVTEGLTNINTFWGSKSWLGNDGKPLKEHMYDKKYLFKSTVESI